MSRRRATPAERRAARNGLAVVHREPSPIHDIDAERAETETEVDKLRRALDAGAMAAPTADELAAEPVLVAEVVDTEVVDGEFFAARGVRTDAPGFLDRPAPQRKELIHPALRHPKALALDLRDRAWWWCKFHGLRMCGPHELVLLRHIGRGAGRALPGVVRWASDQDGRDLVAIAKADDRDRDAAMHKSQHRRTVYLRSAGTSLGASAVLTSPVWADNLVAGLPWWMSLVGVGLGGGGLAWFGRPLDGTPFLPRAADHEDSPAARVITDVMIREALVDAGLSRNNDPASVDFAQPPTRVVSGTKGWECVVVLPGNKTAIDAIKAEVRIASGLDIDESRLFLERVRGTGGSARRVSLFVANEDPMSAPPIKTPLADTPQLDFMKPFPFGTDARGELVRLSAVFSNDLLGAQPGMGKALALDTEVPTPTGWTTMGELQDGDVVYDEAGKPCNVVKAWPVRDNRPCFEVAFSDGTTVVADAEHQWAASSREDRKAGDGFRVVTTAQMASSVHIGSERRANWSVAVAGPLAGQATPMAVGPYTLGAWLGDGTSCTGVITTPDPEVVAGISAEGEQIRVQPSTAEDTSPGWRVLGLGPRLRTLGVLNDKHIPVAYLRAPEEDRRALLAGLLDTDGWCEKQGNVRFAVTNERLGRDVHHLACSLGYKATLTTRPARLNGKDCGTSWQVTFTTHDPVFRLARKVERQVTEERVTNGRRFITAIRPVASVPVRCITVDSPSSQYLVTRACVPTHNTFTARLFGAAAALDPYVQLMVFDGKGGSDWMAFEKVAHRFGLGERDAVVELLLKTLRELKEDMADRYERMRDLRKRGLVRESKVTSAIAKNPALKMPITVLVIDEVQEYFDHPKYGAELKELAINISRRGRALGIVLILATQRPDGQTIPTKLRANCQTRLCGKVDNRDAVEMVLGSLPDGAPNPMRIQRHQMGTVVVLGASDDNKDAQFDGRLVRAHYMDDDALDAIIARAHALRTKAGTVTGAAAGEQPAEDAPSRLLDDVLDVFRPGEDKVWLSNLAARLAEAWPQQYSGYNAELLGKQLRNFKPAGVKAKGRWEFAPDTEPVWGAPDDPGTDEGRSPTRRGVSRDSLMRAHRAIAGASEDDEEAA